MSEITKTDRIMNRLGYVGMLVACFCWGWNKHHFNKEK